MPEFVSRVVEGYVYFKPLTDTLGQICIITFKTLTADEVGDLEYVVMDADLLRPMLDKSINIQDYLINIEGDPFFQRIHREKSASHDDDILRIVEQDDGLTDYGFFVKQTPSGWKLIAKDTSIGLLCPRIEIWTTKKNNPNLPLTFDRIDVMGIKASGYDLNTMIGMPDEDFTIWAKTFTTRIGICWRPFA